MKYRGLLLDFYGTVVSEDDAVVAEICHAVAQAAGPSSSAPSVANAWSQRLREAWSSAHGSAFKPQRDLCVLTLRATADDLGAEVDAEGLSEKQFEFWRAPDLFPDALEFLSAIELPVCVVSNIDRDDLDAAIALHGLRFQHVLTSEDVAAYKPRLELFQAGLARLGLGAREVLHIGDSLANDVKPALALGIDVAWLNRTRRRSELRPTYEAADFRGLMRQLRDD